MEIKRIDVYRDSRFSKNALYQHGCFLVDDIPYQIEIISDNEALIKGADRSVYSEVIEKFRFYAPHITHFYDKDRYVVKEFPAVHIFTILLHQIQPSQFYVNKEKIEAVSSFVHKPDDIIIQVLPCHDRYISLDGHTRLYYAVMQGWNYVRAIIAEESEDWMFDFAREAEKRNIHTPNDLIVLNHEEYLEKWNHFCDKYVSQSISD